MAPPSLKSNSKSTGKIILILLCPLPSIFDLHNSSGAEEELLLLNKIMLPELVELLLEKVCQPTPLK
jgi:hypothetical protein